MNKRFFLKTISFFILITLLISLHAYSSSFAYYPVRVSLSPVPPPIVFSDPQTPGVYVNIGTGGVSATVSVAVRYAITLVGDVIYSQTFDTNWPPPGWAQSQGSSWSTTSSPAWVGRSATDTTTGGVPLRVAYYNSPILSANFNGDYYLAAYVRSTNLGFGRLVGVMFYNSSTGQFYGCAIGNATANTPRLEIVYGIIMNLNRVPASISTNTWYMLLCVINPSSGSLLAMIYRITDGELIASASAQAPINIGADTVGLFVSRSGGGGQVTGYFDELVVSTNNPLAIGLGGIPSGWVARLYNGSALIESVTSTGATIFFNRFWYNPTGQNSTILRQGRIEVYDSNNVLRAIYGPATIVGGQVYSLSPQAVSNLRILDIGNNDYKNYYGKLLLAISITSTGFQSISIYLCSPSACSSAITLQSQPGSQTTEIQIPVTQVSGYSYVRIDYATSQSGASASIQIYLKYYTVSGENGALVFYPISINLV